MATIEERLARIEHEHAALKEKIELQTIAIGALVTKATLERLNEKNDKIIEALTAHDRFTNVQLAELRNQHIEEDGKIVGLQTEMRQSFDAVNARFDAVNARFDAQDKKFDQIMLVLNTFAPKPDQEA